MLYWYKYPQWLQQENWPCKRLTYWQLIRSLENNTSGGWHVICTLHPFTKVCCIYPNCMNEDPFSLIDRALPLPWISHWIHCEVYHPLFLHIQDFTRISFAPFIQNLLFSLHILDSFRNSIVPFIQKGFFLFKIF
jgi:hypothetical protein